MQKDLSVIVPVMNEEECLTSLCQSLISSLDRLDRSYEVIIINDGSTDQSEQILREIALRDNRFSIINFRKNFGQAAAFDAGFKAAEGAVIVTMDGDLQNDPADIARILERLDSGYDMVVGWRRRRKDNTLFRILPSLIANRIIGWATGVKLHDYGCSLKACRASTLRYVDLYGEMHRFIPALCASVGARITEMEVSHHPRKTGRTKYGISRIFRVIPDLLTVKMQMKFATRPMHFLGYPGFLCLGAGSAICLYLSFVKLVLNQGIGGRPLLILGVLLIIVGLQFFGIGLLAEVMVRTYHEASGKRPYLVRSTIKDGHEVVV